MSLHHTNRPTRRDLLKLGAAGAAGLCLGGLRISAAADVPARKQIPVALQLYSIRGECGKDGGKNLTQVVQAVAKMGYDGVEFAGYYGWKPQDLRKLLDDNNLKCYGTHTGLTAVLGDALNATVELHKTLGCKFIIVPGMGGKYTESIQAWKDTGKLFAEIAGKLKADDMAIGYHNHSHEFKAKDGQVPWDVFFQSAGRDVIMQLDVGNGMGGGCDPVATLKKLPGQARSLHVKEYGGGPTAVVGEGDAPWKEIIPLARTIAGTEVFVIEHERKAQDPMEAVAKCITNFRKLLAEV